ncbi:MAG: hypothetical protein LBK95_16490 [Bifidobacteriaceae bacterium]|jgi:hypothetical protein|nr:hypothetical protein [Bifidobacteriaceae bacterium]
MRASRERERAAAAFTADSASWGRPSEVLSGREAAAFGTATLRDAGVDVEAVERAHAGRPRVDGRAIGSEPSRSPRVNVAVSREVD